MQREIKFRAWREKRKVMSPVLSFFDWVDLGSACGEFVDKGDVKLMQFTGLKDKNGVEIYDGDIVRAFSVFDMAYDYCFDKDNEPKKTYQIIFDDGCFQFKNTKQWSDGSNDWRSIENVELFKVEVIGNIYENPELLGETK